MIPKEWIEDYFRRADETDITIEELMVHPGLVVNDLGFAVYEVEGDHLAAMCWYGDGKYWDDFFVQKARELGLKKVVGATKRNPASFVRKFGYRVVCTLLEKEV